MEVLVRDDVPGLAVLDDDKKVAVGWLTHRGVLRAYRVHVAPDAFPPRQTPKSPT